MTLIEWYRPTVKNTVQKKRRYFDMFPLFWDLISGQDVELRNLSDWVSKPDLKHISFQVELRSQPSSLMEFSFSFLPYVGPKCVSTLKIIIACYEIRDELILRTDLHSNTTSNSFFIKRLFFQYQTVSQLTFQFIYGNDRFWILHFYL